jgi:MFS family permease
LRIAVLGSTVGAIIVSSDVLLYSSMAGLVFGRLFFLQSDPLVGILQAFGIFVFGFIARPIGAAIFGHYGDRIGRKPTLIATFLITGFATLAVGLVPTYQAIGIGGAVILTVIRFIQGIGIGGEWAGSVLLPMEWARTNQHRGFITSWPQCALPAGIVLSNVSVLALNLTWGADFLVWGWRLPFMLSIVAVGIAVYLVGRVLETPIFKRVLDDEKVARAPVIEVVREQPGRIILTALTRMAEQAPFFVFLSFIFTYGTTVLHTSRDMLLLAVLLGAALSILSIPLAGQISDQIGRKRMYLIGAAAMAIFGFVYFALLNTAIPALIFIAIILSFVPHAMMYGCQAALITECFAPRLRYSGSSLGFHLGSLVAGAPAPLVATALFTATGTGYSLAFYILGCAIISIIATLFLPDNTNRDISSDEAYFSVGGDAARWPRSQVPDIKGAGEWKLAALIVSCLILAFSIASLVLGLLFFQNSVSGFLMVVGGGVIAYEAFLIIRRLARI